jgi:polyhydroxyalkanoate synthesis regulator phasin
MAKTTASETEDVRTRTPLFEISRKILLAGIGAAVLAQDEIETFVNRLVDEGELAEKDARALVKEMMERREMLDRKKKSESRQPAAATKADIEALNLRIAELNKKIEELTNAAKPE